MSATDSGSSAASPFNLRAEFRSFTNNIKKGMNSLVMGSMVTEAENAAIKFMEDEVSAAIAFAQDGTVGGRGFLVSFWFWFAGMCNFFYQLMCFPNANYGIMNSILALLGCYIMIIGGVMMLVEYKNERFMTRRIGGLLKTQFIFLYRPLGRPCVYICLGVFVMRLGDFANVAGLMFLIAGLIGIFFGILIFTATVRTQDSLQQLKFVDFNKAKNAYNDVDKDGNGNLDSREFVLLCNNLGFKFSHSEIENALLELDGDHNGTISWAEFSAWFSKLQDTHCIYDVHASTADNRSHA